MTFSGVSRREKNPLNAKTMEVYVLKCQKTTEEKCDMSPYYSRGVIKVSRRLSIVINPKTVMLTPFVFSQNTNCSLLHKSCIHARSNETPLFWHGVEFSPCETAEWLCGAESVTRASTDRKCVKLWVNYPFKEAFTSCISKVQCTVSELRSCPSVWARSPAPREEVKCGRR